MNKIEYSIVIPVYNSEKTLAELTERINEVFSNISNNYEIIFIDDHSSDNSWFELKKIHRSDSKVKIINLLKNFGQHNAILCGLNYATGEFIVTMDDDLQHPPEEIPKLIEKIKEGYSVVYGNYLIKQHSRLENFFSTCFQSIVYYILEIPNTIFLSSFAIFKADAVKNMISIKSSYVFLPALVQKSVPVTKITNADVHHHPRKVGRSNYSIRKYLQLSLNLIINYSTLPLVLVGIFGGFISLLSFLYGLFILGSYLLDSTKGLMGWNSMMVTLTFLGGMILFSIAIIGEYLRRILTEVSFGQQYVIGKIEL